MNKLANIGYTLPTVSSMTIQAIDAGSYHDVAGFYARIARTNQNDVVLCLTSGLSTYISMVISI
jgi:hypothetical protein